MKHTKRFLSILLTVCMMLTMIPMTASAAAAPIRPVCQNVAKLEVTEFGSSVIDDFEDLVQRLETDFQHESFGSSPGTHYVIYTDEGSGNYGYITVTVTEGDTEYNVEVNETKVIDSFDNIASAVNAGGNYWIFGKSYIGVDTITLANAPKYIGIANSTPMFIIDNEVEIEDEPEGYDIADSMIYENSGEYYAVIVFEPDYGYTLDKFDGENFTGTLEGSPSGKNVTWLPAFDSNETTIVETWTEYTGSAKGWEDCVACYYPVELGTAITSIELYTDPDYFEIGDKVSDVTTVNSTEYATIEKYAWFSHDTGEEVEELTYTDQYGFVYLMKASEGYYFVTDSNADCTASGEDCDLPYIDTLDFICLTEVEDDYANCGANECCSYLEVATYSVVAEYNQITANTYSIIPNYIFEEADAEVTYSVVKNTSEWTNGGDGQTYIVYRENDTNGYDFILKNSNEPTGYSEAYGMDLSNLKSAAGISANKVYVIGTAVEEITSINIDNCSYFVEDGELITTPTVDDDVHYEIVESFTYEGKGIMEIVHIRAKEGYIFTDADGTLDCENIDADDCTKHYVDAAKEIFEHDFEAGDVYVMWPCYENPNIAEYTIEDTGRNIYFPYSYLDDDVVYSLVKDADEWSAESFVTWKTNDQNNLYGIFESGSGYDTNAYSQQILDGVLTLGEGASVYVLGYIYDFNPINELTVNFDFNGVGEDLALVLAKEQFGEEPEADEFPYVVYDNADTEGVYKAWTYTNTSGWSKIEQTLDELRIPLVGVKGTKEVYVIGVNQYTEYNFTALDRADEFELDPEITLSQAKAIAKIEVEDPVNDIVIYGTTEGGFKFIVYNTSDQQWYDYTEDYTGTDSTFMNMLYGGWKFTDDFITYTTICDILKMDEDNHIYVIGELLDNDVEYEDKTFSIELNSDFLEKCTVTSDRGGYYMLPEGSYYLSDDLTLEHGLQFNNYVQQNVNGIEPEVSENDLLLNGHVLNGTSMETTNAILFPVTSILNVYGGSQTVAHNFKDSTTVEGLWVWDDADGTYNVNGGVITGAYNADNDYSSGAGGAIMNCHSFVNIFDVNIIGNYAVEGAAMFCTSGETDFENQEHIFMSGGSIQGNSGGTIVDDYTSEYAYENEAQGYINIENVNISNNYSEYDAIVVTKGISYITDCTFTENESTYGCVAVYADSDNEDDNNIYAYVTVDGCTFTNNKTQWGTVNAGGHFTIKDTEITGNTVTNTEDERLDTFGGAGIDWWGDYTPDSDGYFRLEGKVICKDNLTNGEPDNLLIELYDEDNPLMINLENFSEESEIWMNHALLTTDAVTTVEVVTSGDPIPEDVFFSDDADVFYNAFNVSGSLEKYVVIDEVNMTIDTAALDFTTWETLARTVAENTSYTTNNDTVAYRELGVSVTLPSGNKEDLTLDMLDNEYPVVGSELYEFLHSEPKLNDTFGTLVLFVYNQEYMNYVLSDDVVTTLNGENVATCTYKWSEYDDAWASALAGEEKISYEYDDIHQYGSERSFYMYLHFDNIAEFMEEVAKTNGCDITFNTNGGTSISAIHIEYNKFLGQSVATTRDNSTFNGWYDEFGNKIDLSTYKFKRSTELTAKWIQKQSTGDTIVPTDYDENSTTTKIQVTGDTGAKASGLEEIAAAIKETNATENVKIILTAVAEAEEAAPSADVTALKVGILSSEKMDFFDIKLDQVIGTTTSAIHDTGSNIIEVIVSYDSTKSINGVFKYHNSNVIEFTNDNTKSGANNTYFIENNELHMFTTEFSTYAVRYTESTTPIYNGGGDDTTYYNINAEDTENGTLTISRKTAYSGATVNLTVKPDTGYELNTITVETNRGTKVDLVVVKTGETYKFTMPAYSVNVTVTFKKTGVCPQDSTCVYAKFTDADVTAWYHDGVHYCVEHSIMNGYGNNLFGPGNTLSRAMVVQMLWNLEGNPYVNYAMSFKDVDQDAWYAEAVRWAQSNGVVSGYSSEEFGPSDAITREQLATILYRFAEYKKYNISETANLAKFDDSDKISNWALKGMQWANANSIVNGKSTYVLDPTGNATRAEAACMFQRFCENIVK